MPRRAKRWGHPKFAMKQYVLNKKPPRQARLFPSRKVRRRRCILTRREGTTDGMIRFIVGPDRRIVADLAERLPGRGLWLSANRAVLEEACAKRTFTQAACSPMIVGNDLPAEVSEQLTRRALNYLGLAMRAGVIALGHDQVRADISAGRAALLLQAADGAVQTRARIRTLAHGLPTVEMFTRAELSHALGRNLVVHAALRPSTLADRFLIETRRLGGFRETGDSRLGPYMEDERQDQKGIE